MDKKKCRMPSLAVQSYQGVKYAQRRTKLLDAVRSPLFVKFCIF